MDDYGSGPAAEVVVHERPDVLRLTGARPVVPDGVTGYALLRPSVALLILVLAVALGFVSAMATTW